MTRPLHIWSLFALCLAVLLAAMGWVSFTAVRLDHAQQAAGQQAEVEERVRLALWRMDSALTALVVEESARPYYAYNAFHAAERAYTKGYTAIKQGDVLQPSPLLTYLPTNVLLHFQFTAAGALTSPQVPLGNERALAETNYTSREKIEAAAARLAELQKLLNERAGPDAYSIAGSLGRWDLSYAAPNPVVGSMNNRDVLFNTCAPAFTNLAAPIALASLAPEPPPLKQSRQTPQSQTFRNSAEWNARNNVIQQQNFQNDAQPAGAIAPANLNLSEGPFKATWLGSALVLARRVTVEGRPLIQGCWLDWEPIRASLRASVGDLFPSGDLQPVSGGNGDKDTRRLAALPARLVTGPLELEALPFWSPIRFSLLVAWLCVLLAALAVAVLLHGAVSLSERRGAFVSAVTHELLTPLTTFKMYSEMLAEGMVPDETKRKHYLATLCSEANRLSHLVENVLAYARLERGSARSRVERVTLRDLIERTRARLEQRAEQAGLRVVADANDKALDAVVHVDVSAVEQILFNLVDNACKYAAPTASEKLIHLEARAAARPDKFALLRVRDHGQGISADESRRLFKPFSKSAHEAAHTAPGVGLGLALCRRLSRSLGGDLRLDSLVKDGACFVLTLPVSRPEPAAPA